MGEADRAGTARSPERRCVACGTRARQDQLLRLHVEDVGSSAVVVFDVPGAPRRGRGAYVCARRACLERAMSKRVFCRVFRRTVTFDEEVLREVFAGLVSTKEGSGR